ncbi:hypothetical protein MKX03_008288 [Papaver bracteatum]|nr:hypothetical protein MKX03_008288 [Papaver bracteatum]
MTKENGRRFKKFEKRIMENVFSLMFRPVQFFRPQHQIDSIRVQRHIHSTWMQHLAIKHGCSSRFH